MWHEDSFHNQRRNLILISFAVLITNIVGFNSLSFISSAGSLSNPELIPVILLSILLYFLSRYLQFFHVNTETGISELITSKQGRYAGNYLLKKCIAEGDKELIRYQQKYRRVIGHFNRDPLSIGDTGTVSGKLIFLENIKYDQNNAIVDKAATIAKSRFHWFYLLAMCYMFFKTPKFSEYFFPPIFGFFAMLTYVDSLNHYLISILTCLAASI